MARRKRSNVKKDYWLSPAGLVLIQGWARDGLSMDQIAKEVGIARSTLFKWKDENKMLSDALLINREIADRQVENALFKIAKGYHYTEDKIAPNGNKISNVKSYQGPNVGAIKLWLANRKPDTWREKQSLEVTGKVDTRLNDVSTEDLIAHFKSLEENNGSVTDDEE